MIFDVIVIGAGPAGSSTAMVSALEGAETLLLEEHDTVGIPQHCAGILYDPDFEKTRISLPEECIQAKVKEAQTTISDAASIAFKAPFTIVDRPRMDRYLSELAVKSGATLWTGSKAVNIKRQDGKMLITVLKEKERRKEIVESKCVIAGDGYQSQIAKRLGLTVDLELASCIQYEVEPSPLDSDNVLEIYMGGIYSPGGYAWVVPVSKQSARIGLGVRHADKPAKFYLDKFIKFRCSTYKILKVMGHCVPLNGPLSKTYDSHLLLAGDAAGQVISTSGAGISSSIICGKMAGRRAAEAVKFNDFSSQFFSCYERYWKKALGSKFKATLQIKEMLDNLSDDNIKGIKEALQKGDVKELIEKGKIFEVIFKVLSKKPSLIKYIPAWYKAKKYGIF